MTALKRRIAAATVAVAIGMGVHQAWRASLLRNQVQLLQQQEAARAEQSQQLLREREEAVNQLAGLRQENERLGRNATEVLKLRAEVAQLKRSSPNFAQPDVPAEKNPNPSISQIESWDEATLNEQQRKMLKAMSEKVITGNSVADLGRLKDSLKRWDELFLTPAPPDLKPVFYILKHRVQARVAELEQQQQQVEAVAPAEPPP